MTPVQEAPAVSQSYPLVVIPAQSDQAAVHEDGTNSPAQEAASAVIASMLLERVAAQPNAQPQHSTFKLGTVAHFFFSHMNVRDDDEENDVSDLLPLVASKGLLQNLIGYDEVIDGAPTGRVGVIGGRRRLKCLGILTGIAEVTDAYAEAFFGLFPEDYSVPYLLVSEAEAVAISLAENSGRKDMTAPQIARAMLAMFAAGAAVEELATAFGIETKLVRQYLKLANLAPSLFEQWRKAKLNFQQVRALCLTDDHARQLSVMETLGSHASEWQIRNLLTEDKLNPSHPLVKYVTLKSYTDAGGMMEADLFSTDEDVYLTDIPLLHKLASEKLAKKAGRVGKEGHAWVDVRVTFTDADKSDFAAVRMVTVKPTPEQEKELTDIDAALTEQEAKLDAAYEATGNGDGDDEEGDEESEGDNEITQLESSIQALEQRKAEIRRSLRAPLETDAALAGAVVTIDRNGQAKVVPGLIRPQDKSMMEQLETPAENDKPVTAKPDHSDRLTGVLTSQRTVALQAELMKRPDVALVVATHALVAKVLLERTERYHASDACKISLTLPRLADEVAASKAGLEVAARKAELVAMLPETSGEGELLIWMLKQPQTVVLDLLAFCTAMACDLTLQRDDGKATDTDYKLLGQSVGLDMRNWWVADSVSYFGHVSKNRMMQVVQDAVSVEKSVPLEKMKKGEAAEAATLAVASTGWLPSLLRAE